MIAKLALLCLMGAPTSTPTLDAKAEFTWGVFGPGRGAVQIAPRDRLFISLRVNGLAQDKLGQVSAIVKMELKRPDGSLEQILRRETGTVNLWQGQTLRGQFTHATSQDDQSGNYHLCFHILDRHSGQETRQELPFTVVPTGFHLLGPVFYGDQAGQIAAGPNGVCGQRLFVKVGVVGFGTQSNKSKARCRLEVLAGSGQVVHKLESPPLELAAPVISFDAEVPLLQAGAFTLRLTVSDEVTNQERSVEVPLKVSEP